MDQNLNSNTNNIENQEEAMNEITLKALNSLYLKYVNLHAECLYIISLALISSTEDIDLFVKYFLADKIIF